MIIHYDMLKCLSLHCYDRHITQDVFKRMPALQKEMLFILLRNQSVSFYMLNANSCTTITVNYT